MGERLAARTSAVRASAFEALEPAQDSSVAAALYERHSGLVFGYCLSRLGRREDAEDAVQTTFLHAVRGLRRGVVPATEVGWLLGIARNVCLSRWESVGRRSRLESPCDPHELDRRGRASEGSREELIGIEDALQELPDQQRRAVLLRDWRGLSYEEVAAQLGVSQAAVETLIFRGRRTLADLLREEPRTTRRRLRSLGDLGSILSGIKAAFTGSAAVTKIAVAATAAAVALTGVGALVGPPFRGQPDPLRAGPATGGVEAPVSRAPTRAGDPSHGPRAATVGRMAGSGTSARGAVTPTGSATATPAASPDATSAPTTSVTPTGDTAADPTRTSSAANPEATPRPRQLLPVQNVIASPPPIDVVPVVTTAVNDTVNTLLPNLPVGIPSVPLPPILLPDEPATAAVVEVVESVPTVVSEPPVTVTLPPVTPPKLLP